MNPPVLLYRVANLFYRYKLKPVSGIISWLNRLFFSTWIPGSANIGSNFKLGYWGLGVVIHSNACIGNNCTIAQNVTIGRNFRDIKVPVIGDNVYIGAGTVVFGEIFIGDNVIIGANSVVNTDIPSGVIAVGNPAKIIKKNNMPYWEYDKVQ
ncbi:serine O-acetyltransferase [Fulvivirga kasyanovii]|uniref:Serine acetyltransferase n=1 Tax=Fulvivirga kasyanovii TaxID=396812 RepID=A0ABW9RMQ1_9BACT|nr:serine acetyltransferase [Fulvivirga kasyanovii]MTI24649.1 serine acetyltransferase [Fulvivirga kasyanovii]